MSRFQSTPAELREARSASPSAFIRNTCLLFLQACYSTRAVGKLRYLEDDSKTEILIADQFPELTAKETRPGIVSSRGHLRWMSPTMGDGRIEQDMRSGVATHGDLVVGSIGFSCLSRNDIEAEQIASDVFSLFRRFQRELRELGFNHIRPTDLSVVQLVEQQGYDKLYMVNVVVECSVADRWILSEQPAAELRKVITEFVTPGGSS